mgnify:CR=1 FL=1
MCFKKKAKKAEEAKKVEEAKKAEAKKESAKKAPAKETPKKEGKRVYHVSKREEDGMWTVKYAGGEKVIKLFKTKAEAVEFTEKMAENQGGVMLKHNSKGAHKGQIRK